MSHKFLFVGGVATTSAVFGQGTRRIVLNYAQCDGSEEKLTDCQDTAATCSRYNEHAGVYCQERRGT